MYRRGMRFVRREFGRRLARELIGNRKLNMDNARKLEVLRRQYRLGWLAVIVTRLLPASLVTNLITSRVHPNEYARSSQTR